MRIRKTLKKSGTKKIKTKKTKAGSKFKLGPIKMGSPKNLEILQENKTFNDFKNEFDNEDNAITPKNKVLFNKIYNKL